LKEKVERYQNVIRQLRAAEKEESRNKSMVEPLKTKPELKQ
jgi:hypothetical protein